MKQPECPSSDPSPSVEAIRRDLGDLEHQPAFGENAWVQVVAAIRLTRAALAACDAKDAEIARLRAGLVTVLPTADALRDQMVRQAEAIDAKVRQRYVGQIRELQERAEQAESALSALRSRISYLEGTAMPHARKQENANGFQKGWHAAFSRAGEHAESIEYLRALVPEPAINADKTPVAPSGADEPKGKD